MNGSSSPEKYRWKPRDYQSLPKFRRQGIYSARKAIELTLMQEFVIQDAGREPGALRFLLQFFRSSDASLAKHGAVFLARDLFRHFENHLHQRVVRKALRAL